MKNRILIHHIRLILASALILISANLWADVAVIASKDLNTSIDLDMLKAKYLGKNKSSPKNENGYQVVNQPYGNPNRILFDKVVLKKSEANIRTYWARMIFTSRARPPVQFNNDKEVLKYLSTSKSSVAYVNRKSLEENPKLKESVKILFIINEASMSIQTKSKP